MIRLSSAVLFRRYPKQDIRRTQFEFEDFFGPLIAPTAQVLNSAPGAPSNQPRFVFSKDHLNLSVSDVATQLVFGFDNPVSPSTPSISEIERFCGFLDNGMNKILGKQRAWFSGIVFTFHIPSGPWATQNEFTADKLYTQLFKPNWPGNIESLSAVIAAQKGKLRTGVEVSQYKMFTKIATQAGIFIDDAFESPNEEGTQIKVDLNNNPQRKSPPPSSNFAILMSEAKRVIIGDLPLWIGKTQSDAVSSYMGTIP